MSGGKQKSTVLILINADIRESIKVELKQFISDLETLDGYAVRVDDINGGSPEELRAHIINQYDLLSSSNPLAGCVLIGDLPVPWFGVTEKFPLDAFFMDLHGDWGIDANGEIISIPGQIIPEIWVGRLTAGPLSGNEVDLLKNYFARNHAYRTGQMNVVCRAMAYVDDDWTFKGDYGLISAYQDVKVVNDVGTTDAFDFISRLSENYELIQVAVHSSASAHTFKNNHEWSGSVTNMQILATNPQAVFYCFDACRVARYTDNDYIGGCYIFSNGHGLAVIGETQNANAMEAPSEFYALFGQGLSFGDSFIKWLNFGGRANYHKDRTILGDPTLKKQSEYTAAKLAAPSNLRIVS
jgi:hypothetical protein